MSVGRPMGSGTGLDPRDIPMPMSKKDPAEDAPTMVLGGDAPLTDDGGDAPITEEDGDAPMTDPGGDTPLTGRGEEPLAPIAAWTCGGCNEDMTLCLCAAFSM
jgi:hypothetical protein